MCGAGNYKTKPEWRKNLKWHLSQLLYSRKVWKRNNQDKHLDLLTFHCWRVNRLYSEYYIKNDEVKK
jgi:hypothetical protein